MNRPDRRPLKRLLIIPALLVIALVTGIQSFQTLTRPDADTGQPLEVGKTILPGPTEIDTCARGGDQPDGSDLGLPTPGEGRVTAEQVTACPEAFDGRRVTYVGELVGDLLHREEGAWVLVNDDDYALEVGPLPAHADLRGTNSGLAVWLPDDLLDDITGLGRPNQRGDLVELTGAIARTDPADGGGLTLRADRMTVLSPSTRTDEWVDLRQLWLAVAAMGLAATTAVLRRLRPTRRRAVE
jgi:hypothetical protein